jgi:hypothetical protein
MNAAFAAPRRLKRDGTMACGLLAALGAMKDLTEYERRSGLDLDDLGGLRP